MPSFNSIITLSSLIASLITPAAAHTWIEEYQVIGPNGSYIGDRGFSRGYVARTDADFAGDSNIKYLMPPLEGIMPDGGVRNFINSTDLICHPNQRTRNYTDPRYPMLKASPGSYVAAKYLENGHVTLPWNQPGKPENRGTVFVYGTTNPSKDERMVDVLKWNADGTGGNKRGFLMTAQDFDDGRCHQINECKISVERQAVSPNRMADQPDSQLEQWCETNFQIPKDQKSGKLTTYWVWQWPTLPNEDCVLPEGKDEYYTTCADFEIQEGGPGEVKIAEEPSTNTLEQENHQTTAVGTYKYRTRMAIPTNPVIINDWNSNNSKRGLPANSVKVDSSFASKCSVSLAQPADTGIPPLCPDDKWATGALGSTIAQNALAAAKKSPTPKFRSTTTPVAAWIGSAAGKPTGSGGSGPPPAASTTPPPAPAPVPDVSVSTVTETTTVTEEVAAVPSPSTQTSAPPPESKLNTLSTVHAAAASGAEHLARHRGHARYFAG